MPTPFLTVYDKFLIFSTDNAFLEKLTFGEQEEILRTFLLKAVMDFDSSQIELDYDLENKEFINELTEDEINILAEYMNLYWVRRLLQDEELLRKSIGDRDYTIYSPANHMKNLSEVESAINKRVIKRVYKYSIKHVLKRGN